MLIESVNVIPLSAAARSRVTHKEKMARKRARRAATSHSSGPGLILPPQHQRRTSNMAHANKTINGVSHAAVTMPASARLIALLESPEYGNRLSEDHKTALMAILGTMTEMAQGELRGRLAFGLPREWGRQSQSRHGSPP